MLMIENTIPHFLSYPSPPHTIKMMLDDLMQLLATGLNIALGERWENIEGNIYFYIYLYIYIFFYVYFYQCL